MKQSVPVLVWDFAFLLVRFNKNTSITDKMGISFSQNQLHSFRVNKSDKSKHSLLLIRDSHILNWAVHASENQQVSEMEDELHKIKNWVNEET